MPVPIREDLKAALERAWAQLGETGTWLDGVTRTAVAREARNARNCALCGLRRQALSPYTVAGDHDHLGELPDIWVEAVHRLVTDSGRITAKWVKSVVDAGLLEDEYVEILAVVTIITSMDTFMRGIGMELAELPAGSTAPPVRRHRSNARPGPGWVATIAPEDAGPELEGFYGHGAQYIRRALTLVPEEARKFWDLMYPLYLPDPTIAELEGEPRAISRAQMEFLAARVSALLDCFY